MTAATTSRPRLPLDHDPVALVWVRKAKGLRQMDLARAAGISQGHMCDIESGRRNAPPHLLVRFAEALNCPVVMIERRRLDAAPPTDEEATKA